MDKNPPRLTPFAGQVRICHGKTCGHHAEKIMNTAKNKITSEHLEDKVNIETCHCLGQCEKSPNILVESEGKRQIKNSMSPKAIEREIDILSGKNKEVLIKPGESKEALDNLLSGRF